MSSEPVPGLPEVYNVRLDLRPVHLSSARIARTLGYRCSVPDFVAEAIGTVCADLAERSRPSGGFRLCDTIVTSDRFTCGEAAFHAGEEIVAQLQQAQRLAVFAATVGEGYEQLHQEYTEQDEPLLLYVLDAAGSEMAERLADRVQRAIRETALGLGMSISNRYSPGYCGWSVCEQHRLFSLLPPGFCGIALSPTAMMRPIKSVSGIVGLGKEIKRNPYRCDLCNMRETCHAGSRLQRSS